MAIRKRVLPSGRTVWLAGYVDSQRQRRFKQFDKRDEAKQWLIKVGRDLQLGTHVADSASITIAEAAKLWLSRCDDIGLERSTRDAYRQHVDLHISPLIGQTKLSQLTTPGVHDFADKLAKDRSPAMVKRIVRSLGAIIGEAKRRGLANTNPVTDAKIKLIGERRKSKRPEIPTRDELKALLRTANGKHRALIVVALFSGLRASELRGLKWLDVDLERAVIRVRGRVDAWGEYGLPKSTAGHRDVPIAPYAIASLKEHRLITRNSDSDYVFVSESGTPLYHQNIINRIWNPLQIEAGLCTTHATKKDDEGNPVKVAKFNFHVLRHAAASLFIEQGLSPKRIQTIMGHSSITVTYDVYGHLFEDDEADQAAVAAIQARLLG